MSNGTTTETETKSTTIAAPEKPKTPILHGERGLELRSFEDLWRFAQCVASSGLAPKGMESPASIVVALQMGAEVGLPPMAALQNVAVINGRPSLFGDTPLAICRASGVFDEETFEETLEATGENAWIARCTVRRLPHGKPVTREFSTSDSQRAGLHNRTDTWTKYPRRMLQMRARAWALRDTFPDVLKGVPIAEELQGTETVHEAVPPKPVVSRTAELVRKLAPPPAQPVEIGSARDSEPVTVEASQPAVVYDQAELVGNLEADLSEADSVGTVAMVLDKAARWKTEGKITEESWQRVERMASTRRVQVAAPSKKTGKPKQREMLPEQGGNCQS